MKRKSIVVLAITAFLMLINTGLAFSEAESPVDTMLANMPGVEEAEPEMLWVWGDVVSVDAQNKALVIKRLNYETDQEEELTINTDEKTVFENVASLEEINAKDTVSIDYVTTPETKYIAKNISLEKTGAAEPVAPVTETETPQVPANATMQPVPGAPVNTTSGQ